MIAKREVMCAAAGLLVGIGAFAVGQGLDLRQSGTAVSKQVYPRQEEGRIVTGGNAVLIEVDTKLEDLPLLADASNEEPERYQATDMGDRGFLILDTQTGLARLYDGRNVTLYSSTVPNHTVRIAVRTHSAFE